MDEQQTPPDSITSEREAAEKPSPKSNSIEDHARIWAEVRARTGFTSYQNYIGVYKGRENRADLRLLWERMHDVTSLHEENTCSIIDFFACGNSPSPMAIRCHSSSGSELLAALLQPPNNVRLQIVLWPILSPPLSASLKVSREILNILGLGLRLDPQFFLALLETLSGPSLSDDLNEAVEFRPLHPSHVVIDRAVATLVRHVLAEKPDAAPILLIAGGFNLKMRSKLMDLWDCSCIADQRLNNNPPFAYPSSPMEEMRDSVPGQIEPKWLHIYMKISTSLVRTKYDGKRDIPATITEIFFPLLPLLYMNCYKMKAQLLLLRRGYMAQQAAQHADDIDSKRVKQVSFGLHQKRYWLRRSIEDSEDGIRHFEEYVHAQDAGHLLHSSAYLEVKQEAEQIHKGARRLDTEVRDYLQLVTGESSLEESRKSIELSNHQILEGKQGLLLELQECQNLTD